MSRIVLAFCLLLGAATAPAQTVYETRGPNGPVFSDKPQPGAKAIELKPLNVIENAKLTGTDKKAAPPAAPQAGGEKTVSDKAAGDKDAIANYRSFAIVFPENDGSVVANTAEFEVRLAADPALRLGEGHAFVVSIDGRFVARRFTASEFTIPPEFWGDQLPPPNQRLQLGAAIVDRNGAVLKDAAPVQFYLRHATILQHPHPLKSQLRPPPQPRPVAQGTPEKPTRAGAKLLSDAKKTPEPQVVPMSR